MKIAVEGCTHGELDQIYKTIQEIEEMQGYKVDLLICCGDFQSTRNLSDLKCMACPDKYKDMCSFYKYYSGEAIAPMLTIFIGGNHEASNYLQELAYGGWVAPNIYYLGYAGVIQVNGVRIGGLSGIYKGFDYLHGHHEKPPYDDGAMRSCYHIRNVDVFRLKQLASNPPDVMISHDWPRGITKFGNEDQLLRFKRHFKDDIEQDKLGSGPTKEILDSVKPPYWFAAHLHCKFAAIVEHEEGSRTKFLALDKCLPGRRFLQVLDIGEPVKNDDLHLQYDKHWLTVLKNTNHLLSVEKKPRYTPGPGCTDRYDFTPTEGELKEVETLFKNDFEIPYNFEQSVLAYKPNGARINMSVVSQPQATVNRQTTEFCSKLGILDPMALLVGTTPPPRSSLSIGRSLGSYVNEKEQNLSMNSTLNPDEISLNETEDTDADVFVESETNISNSEVSLTPEVVKTRAPFRLPTPKLDSDDVDIGAVINTSVASAEDTSVKEDEAGEKIEHQEKEEMNDQQENKECVDSGKETNGDGLFFIDNKGTGDLPVPEPPSTPPVKKLKRRNAAMYSAAEDA